MTACPVALLPDGRADREYVFDESGKFKDQTVVFFCGVFDQGMGIR